MLSFPQDSLPANAEATFWSQMERIDLGLHTALQNRAPLLRDLLNQTFHARHYTGLLHRFSKAVSRIRDTG